MLRGKIACVCLLDSIYKNNLILKKTIKIHNTEEKSDKDEAKSSLPKIWGKTRQKLWYFLS